MLKTARSYLHSSGHNTGTWRTDGQNRSALRAMRTRCTKYNPHIFYYTLYVRAWSFTWVLKIRNWDLQMQITHWHGSTSCFKDDRVSKCNSMEKGEIWPPLSSSPKPMATKFGLGDRSGTTPTLCKILSRYDKGFSLAAPAASPQRVDSDSARNFLGGGVLPLL